MSESVCLTLKGAHAGKTIKLGNYNFVDGKILLPGTLEQNAGPIKYLGRCYQAEPEGAALSAISKATITRLVLHGPQAGMTIKLAGYQFIDGVAIIAGSPESNAGPIKYLGRCFQAKLETEEKPDGKCVVQTNPAVTAGPEGVLSSVRPDGEEPSEEVDEPVAIDDGAKADEKPELQATGDGEVGRDDDPEEVTELRAILADLDPDNDKHWTKKGFPSIAFVKIRIGLDINTDEMTKAVKTVWPGFNRTVAKELQK